MAKIEQNEQGENMYRYSEIFHSFQGEGIYTGRNTAWIRFYLCNLSCDGFNQKDPTDPSTYILPYKEFDVSQISRIEDLPVFEYGCDSSYTWAAKYKHLMHTEKVGSICDKIQDVLKSPSNPKGHFLHPQTHQQTHMAFTGGEPMLNQEAILEILRTLICRGNKPHMITVETNGTINFNKKTELKNFIYRNYVAEQNGDMELEWFWSVSPKLCSTSGEKPEKAICPEVVGLYYDYSPYGQLKYVVNGSQQSWDEVEEHTESFRNKGIPWEVYIMPVGATKEQQEDEQIAEIATEAMKRGYHVSGRLHCYMFGNKIGT